ncbi:MAG: hypothetical protein IPL28_15495 [Chloroflexi bacterium]|nr:hypothetical protein [Chloroflexota bacterium]
MSEIHQLYRLQQLDQQIASGKQRLLAVLKGQEEPEPLRSAKQGLAETAARHQKWRTQQKQEELALGSVISKLQSSEERLYSGKVKTPKEMADLQLAVESLRRQRGTMEEGLFATMMTVEGLDAELATAEAQVAALTAEWQAQAAVFKQEQNHLAPHINTLMAQRTEQTQHIPAPALASYEGLRQRKGTAVAELKLNSCQGCRVTLPISLVSQIEHANVLTYCPSCGRFLIKAT